MVRFNTPGSNKSMQLDYDFVHPQKLTAFYECDIYRVYAKGAKNPFYETRDRSTIYYETLKALYENVDPNDPWDFIKNISGIRVRGYVGELKKTEAPFINHITCEISILNSPYFLIDDNWYKVRGDFIKAINDQCSTMIKINEWSSHPLTTPWPLDEMDEGEYNLQYINTEGFIVMDKILGQHIELCDLLYESDDKIYLIHVKEGFDAKIRDLTNQVSISSNRLWNDLKSDSKFLTEVFERLLKSGNLKQSISKDEFLKKFEKEIIYVIAFCHKKNNKKVSENIEDFKSNIAKFSIIQSMREMQSNSYPLKTIEIKASIK
ncbi:DUF6119 family protein [Adhaeribacter terreus]|uniref:DUF6119 family protein n=1 Tax=Adhaeribacter terreus TaxID=529703 RepID=A0ABW0EFL3_9BACT